MARSSAQSKVMTDHRAIRNWAEERGARPACVKSTGGGEDVGMIRLDFPGYSGEESLAPISWDDWFDKFDERNLALLVQEQTARGQRSNFNKLVNRDRPGDAAEALAGGRPRITVARQNQLAPGLRTEPPKCQGAGQRVQTQASPQKWARPRFQATPPAGCLEFEFTRRKMRLLCATPYAAAPSGAHGG